MQFSNTSEYVILNISSDDEWKVLWLSNSDTCAQDDTKKRELLKNPTKIEQIQEKKFIDRN